MVRAFVLVLLWLAPVASVQAQSLLGGVVRYPTGEVATDIPVVVENETTGERFDTRSGALGTYTLVELPQGHYTVSVNHDSLTFLKTDVVVRDGAKTGLDIPLRVGRDERIVVNTEGNAIALGDGSTGGRFTRHALDALPLSTGRTVQSMLNVVPGVVMTDSTGTLAQFTAGGQRRLANRMTIDGVSADLAVDLNGPGAGEVSSGALPAFSTTGSTQTIVPLAAVGEIEVRTTNAPAEYTWTPGAQTSIVTRAGGDRMNGSAFMDYRPNALSASDWFSHSSPTAPQHTVDFWNAGASLGGPVPLGGRRLFYFASGERQHVDRPVTATYLVPSMSLREKVTPAVRELFDAFPRPNGPEVGDGTTAELAREFPIKSKLSTFSLRADGNLSDRHRLFGRVNHGTSGGHALDLVQERHVMFTYREEAATNTATAGLTSVFSSATHEWRVNVSTHEATLTAVSPDYEDVGALPLDLLVPPEGRNDAWVRVATTSGAGGFTIDGRGAAGRQEQFQIADTWTWLAGRHEWRFGADVRRVTTATDAAGYRYGYRFPFPSDLLQGRIRVVIDRALPSRAQRDTIAVFAQDTFRPTPRLTLNYGLRYSVRPAPESVTDAKPLLLDFAALPEIRTLPEGSRLWKTSWSDVAPQATATYQLSNAAGFETSLRAGWSLVFDELTSRGTNALSSGAPYVTRWSPPTQAFPLPQATLSAPPPDRFSSGDLSEYYAFDSGLRSPRTHQWQVTLDQALGPVQRIGLAYIGAAARDLPYWHAWPLNGTLQINAFSDDGRSDYHAMLAQYVRRLSNGFQASLSYTWSHSIDVDSGDTTLPLPPPSLISPSSNRGSSDFDRRHLVYATATYRIPGHRAPEWLRPFASDWQIDAVAMLRSGRPLTVTSMFRPLENGGTYLLRVDPVENVEPWISDATSPAGERLNLAAFSRPEEARQGLLGRNTLRSSPLRQIDLSVSRLIQVGERRLTLRVDAFNVLNTANFGPPETSYESTSRFGRPFQSYANSLGTGTLTSGGLLPVQQVGGPRSIQVSVRFAF